MLKKSLLVIFLVLLFDQILKIWVKTHMFMGEEISVFGDWFCLRFTENSGMAFGMAFAGKYGKLFLSLFRIIAVSFIGWYIYKLSKKPSVKTGLIISMSLIFAGAAGNIFDSAFYGLIFDRSDIFLRNVAVLFPSGGGYESFLYGNVVDMLSFELFTIHFPSWFPFFGDTNFTFFEPIFNISDASITVGVLMLVIFQKRYFGKPSENKEFAHSEKDGISAPPKE